jgi:hypothetical protein
MCRIKKRNDQSNKGSPRRNDKTENEPFITEEITLMIKRLIDESPDSSPLVNSVNGHITRKILDSGVTDHIFCNRSAFISYTPKISICETGTGKKFTAKSTESIQMKLIDDQDRSKLVTLTEMLYSSQLQYNLISTIKLDKKGVETLLSLSIKTSKLLMRNDVIAVADIINSQYVLRENSESRVLAKLAGLGIHT